MPSRLPPKTRMQLTRFRVILLLILAVTSSSLTVWHFASAIPAPSRNSTVEPGSLTTPCNYDVYIDSAKYVARNCATGLNSAARTDVGVLFNTDIYPNCTSTGCAIFLEPGTYLESTTISWQVSIQGDVAIDIFGADSNRTQIKATTNIDVLDFIGTAAKNLNGPTVQGLQLNGGGFNAPNGILYCDLCYGALFTRIIVTSETNVGVSIVGGEANRLQNCQVDNIANAGVNINSAEVWMEACDVFGNAQQGGNGDVQTGGGSRSIFLSDTIGGGFRAALFIGAGSTFVKVQSSFFYNAGELTTNTYDTIHIEASANVTMIGNTIIQDWGSVQTNKARWGLGISNDAPYNIFTDNTFLGPFGSGKIGIFNGGTALGWVIRSNTNYNPFGKITNFLVGTSFAPWGTSSTVVASTTYTTTGVDELITSTGGTGVSINIACGGNNFVAAAATLTNQLVWIGCTITFGAFSVAPTVSVFGN